MAFRCVIFGAAEAASGGPVGWVSDILTAAGLCGRRGEPSDGRVQFPRAFRMRTGSACEQDNAVIRIRYKDFSAGTHNITGLHGVARRGARGVTVYLVPGLNVRQRRAVLRRLRQEASRGFGPPLPLLALVLALCADRVRTTSGTAAALIRLHPAVTLLPGAFVAAVMTLFVLASAGRSVDFIPGPRGGGLALSQAGDVGQISRVQASPVQDRQLFAVDSPGPARGDHGRDRNDDDTYDRNLRHLRHLRHLRQLRQLRRRPAAWPREARPREAGPRRGREGNGQGAQQGEERSRQQRQWQRWQRHGGPAGGSRWAAVPRV